MTDLVLGNDNDLLVINGQLQIFQTKEEFIRQRIMISLNTFTNTWFENINFGINQNLLFAKGTQDLLDQDIKTIISNTRGVINLTSYSSSVDPITRRYTATFSYQTEEGGITEVRQLPFGDTTETVGDLPDNLLTFGEETLTYGEDYLIFGE